MKLLSVKILGNDNFRSLEVNKKYSFNQSTESKRISSKIFAGLNGSGKSNFLELISEIFYYLEIYHLETADEFNKQNINFGFEIEYLLDVKLPLKYENNDENKLRLIASLITQVKIIKPINGNPEFLTSVLRPHTGYTRVDENTQSLLPTKIIAYSSGQNELISNPYLKLQYHYFKEFEKRKTSSDLVSMHRLFFLNYSTNFSIFISNFLLGNETKVNYLKSVLHINKLEEFRITINTEDLYKKVIPVNQSLEERLGYLKKCATTWTEKQVGKNSLLILDFKVTEATTQAFKYFFSNSFNLFKFFYELEIFNLYLVDKKTRDLMLTVHKTYNFSDEMSKPDPSRLVFRIEKIRINKKIDDKNSSRNIYYKALSDGEHQFAEVVGTMMLMEEQGCLFLFDEPDTHFNPKWRSKLMQCLNFMSATSFDQDKNITGVRSQEVIITTHSPFVISDNHDSDVYCFEKKDGIVDFKNPDFKTYGASISIILDEIFDKKESISEMAKKELKEMVDNINTMEDLKKVVERLNNEFGESAEKLDLFSELRNIKTQIESGK